MNPRHCKKVIFAASLIPLVLLGYDALTGGLGADPGMAIVHRLGLWGFRFLLLALAITPARRVTGWNGLARYRRMIGLFAFFYVTLHLLAWAVLDQNLDPMGMARTVLKHPYIAVGMAAFAILAALAATSTNAAIKRMGKNWQKLHRFVYAAGVLAAIHYLMLVKSWPKQPIVYAALMTVLLGMRVAFAMQRRRQRSLTISR